VAAPSVPARLPPTSYAELCALAPEELARCDIALMNLLCAEGLRGSESLNVSNCLALLDGIAVRVKSETDRHLYRFREKPEEFNRSEGYFRLMMMATVLQQDVGIRYNPARMAAPTDKELELNDTFFADSQDVFIHGLARPNGMGTCSSLPVFYVAIGRRVGYPLKLARAKAHLFVRWDEGDRSFNFEATSLGGAAHPDSFYREWPVPSTPEEEQTESYLKPLTPTQELTTFLNIRGQCCRAMTNWAYAVGAFAQAHYLEPQSVGNRLLFEWTQRDAIAAGAMPRRIVLEQAIQTLEIPPGPMQASLLEQVMALNAKNLAGASEAEIERGLEALRAEIEAFRPAALPFNPLAPPDPNPLRPQPAGQNPARGIQPPSR